MSNALVIMPLKVANFSDFIMSEMSRILFVALSLDLDMEKVENSPANK